MTREQRLEAIIIHALDLAREASDFHLLQRPQDALERVREVCLVLHRGLALPDDPGAHHGHPRGVQE